MPQKNINFSISERKLLLRIFDVVVVIAALIGISYLFNFHYFNIENTAILTYMLVLSSYLLLFGQIFEMYNLLPMLDEEGNEYSGVIIEIGEDHVTLDFNHPLAGEDLFFAGKVLSVRVASEEELAQILSGGGGCGCLGAGSRMPATPFFIF